MEKTFWNDLKHMARHSRKLSFTMPILIGFTGILLSFLLIAVFVTTTQRQNFLEDYHHVNRNFTHNLAVNYTESLLRGNDYILARATKFFAKNDKLNQAINIDPQSGLQELMQLEELMPTVSSISLADTQGHYLRAPEVLENDNSRAEVQTVVYQTGGSQYFQPLYQSLSGFLYTASHHYTLQTGHLTGRPAQRQPRISSGSDVNGIRFAPDGCPCSGRVFRRAARRESRTSSGYRRAF
jgi:hypothetical protein